MGLEMRGGSSHHREPLAEGEGVRIGSESPPAGERGTVDGVVAEALPNAMFRVELAGAESVLAHLSGDARLKLVRILPGDRVRLALSPYDRSRGRIVSRLGGRRS